MFSLQGAQAVFGTFEGLCAAAPAKLVQPASPPATHTHKVVVRASVDKARDVAVQAVAEKMQPAVAEVSDKRREPRVYQTPEGYWKLKEEYQTGLNPAEKLKIEKEPMRFFVEDEIEALAKMDLETLDANKEGKDDIDVRLKWLGFFHRRKRQYGRFMMRLKLPNGIITSSQTRYLASVIQKYGPEGCADVTTRQNFQLRGITLEDIPLVLKGMASVGLTSIQSGMDNVRNAVGNPLAGIDPHEIVDTRPYNKALNDFIIANGKGNTSITNLPRKWNVCVIGTHDLFEHPHINDLAYMPAVKDGVFGFNILVGGFFSQKRCAEAIPLDAFVPAEDVVPLCKAVLEAFRDLGFRGNRQKCRMMWLIDELGIEGFREEVEMRMPGGTLPRAAADDLIDKKWTRRDLFGVHPQKQKGLNYVGCLVPVGRLQATDMFEFARIAEKYGSGELRLTVEQNIIIPDVKDEDVMALLAEPLLAKFTPAPSKIAGSLVACTGSQYCGMAIIETKQRALEITRALEATMDFSRPVRMHWTGCPNTCAQIQVADIGFMGCMARDDNKKPCEGVDIYLGGRIGSDSHLGECVKNAVPVTKLLPVVQELLIEHFGATKKA